MDGWSRKNCWNRSRFQKGIFYYIYIHLISYHREVFKQDSEESLDRVSLFLTLVNPDCLARFWMPSKQSFPVYVYITRWLIIIFLSSLWCQTGVYSESCSRFLVCKWNCNWHGGSRETWYSASTWLSWTIFAVVCGLFSALVKYFHGVTKPTEPFEFNV